MPEPLQISPELRTYLDDIKPGLADKLISKAQRKGRAEDYALRDAEGRNRWGQIHSKPEMQFEAALHFLETLIHAPLRMEKKRLLDQRKLTHIADFLRELAQFDGFDAALDATEDNEKGEKARAVSPPRGIDILKLVSINSFDEEIPAGASFAKLARENGVPLDSVLDMLRHSKRKDEISITDSAMILIRIARDAYIADRQPVNYEHIMRELRRYKDVLDAAEDPDKLKVMEQIVDSIRKPEVKSQAPQQANSWGARFKSAPPADATKGPGPSLIA